MIKDIIFDLDGTLWDSREFVAEIWNTVFARQEDLNLQLTQDDLSRLMGKTMEEIGAVLFPDLDEERQIAIMDACGQEELVFFRQHGGILYEKVEETLQILRDQMHCNLYIVSNCQDGYVEAFLHAHQLGAYFKDIEMSGRTGMSKRENISLLMERNKISRQQAIYVGDTKGDYEAALGAGLPFVYASYGFGQVENASQVIEYIWQLPKCI